MLNTPSKDKKAKNLRKAKEIQRKEQADSEFCQIESNRFCKDI